MKRIILAALIAASTPTLSAAGGFTIKGNIPGMPDDALIELISKDTRSNEMIASSKASRGTFTLTGNVASPSLCELRITIDEKEYDNREFPLMVENMDITVSAPHIDSIAPGFYVGSAGLLKSRNVTVNGGRAQQEYKEYQDHMFPYECAAKDAHYSLYWDKNRDMSDAVTAALEKAYDKTCVEETKATSAFIAAHPSYTISGILLTKKLAEPFTFTSRELDEMEKNAESMWDKGCQARVKDAIAKNRKYVKGLSYTDFSILDTDLKECKLSDIMDGKTYVLVDFWASWCGPCRAAIPHVRELYKKYGDRLKVAAVSMDSEEKAWRKAMEQEKMEWTQLWADKTRVKKVQDAYQIKGIPFIMVLDPQGKIVFSGHDKNALSETLSHLLD